MVSVPKWDLNLVLHSLKKAPYEPVALAPLKQLTYKTVFLLALASAKRVSELHGLSCVVKHSHHWDTVTLTFAPDFIAKTQIPGCTQTNSAPIVIPALHTLLSPGDDELALCPVRTLREYLKRTAPFREHCPRLFVSVHTRLPRPIAKNTLSFWLRQVINSAYRATSPEAARSLKVTPHEIRAMATSLAFSRNVSLSQVMSAASWRCHTTFVSHYLRDCSHKYLDVSSLGPIVAAHQVV